MSHPHPAKPDITFFLFKKKEKGEKETDFPAFNFKKASSCRGKVK